MKFSKDSRQITPGSVFYAVQEEYIPDALKRGASAVVARKQLELPVETRVVENVRLEYAKACSEYFDHPSKNVPVFAVTGTNGKTTVALWAAFLAASISDKPAFYIGTLGAFEVQPRQRHIPSSDTTLTTPDAWDLQRLISENQDKAMISLEASSHALDQMRVDFIDIDVGAFTNLSRDHLDYHGSEENYFKAKERLFSELARCSVINSASKWADKIPAKGERVNLTAFEFINREPGSSTVLFEGKEVALGTSLSFNVSNALLAALSVSRLGYQLEGVLSLLEVLPSIDGRFEEVCKNVFVDFAHTPEALELVLQELAGISDGVIAVFGCGGDRDVGKRKLMGEIAEKYTDSFIITNDNPRSESPAKIAAEIKGETKGEVILDRESAIRAALEKKQAGQVVLIAGKGHENYQQIGEIKKHFSDQEIVKKYYARDNQ